MNIKCPCGTKIRVNQQLNNLVDEHHVVDHCRTEARFKQFTVCILEEFNQILSGRKSDQEKERSINNLRILSSSCFGIGGYTPGIGGRFGFSTGLEASQTFRRMQEAGMMIDTNLEHHQPARRARIAALDNLL